MCSSILPSPPTPDNSTRNFHHDTVQESREAAFIEHEQLRDVELIMIDDDVANERQNVTEDLDALTASLATLGLQERVRLYQLPADRYLLASGHRRVAAARALGWSTIPSIVCPLPTGLVQQTISRLASNLCRKDIDPIALALSIRTLFEEYQLSHTQIANWLGKSPTAITNYLRLLELPERVQEYLRIGELTVGHALQILRIKEPQLDWDGTTKATAAECQLSLTEAVINEKLSVRALEVRVRNWLNNNQTVQTWLERQRSHNNSPEESNVCSPEPATLLAGSEGTVIAEMDLCNARRTVARQAIRAALAFDESIGPTLDHLRLAALILADITYFYHNIASTELPDHGEMNRLIEKAQEPQDVINLIGCLVAAQVVTELDFDGESLVAVGRARWAKSRFGLASSVAVALKAIDLADESKAEIH